MRASIGDAIKHFGLNVARRCFSKVLWNHAIQDLTDAEKSIVSRALPFTMTPTSRTLEEAQKNIYSTGHPRNKIKFIKGKLEDTLPPVRPEKLSLLRLDTDWYQSTKVELDILYPGLYMNGILIIDDYGYWQEARYFETRNIRVFLHRIDNTGRIVVGGGATDAR